MNFHDLNSSDWQSFIYLILLLVILLSSLLSRNLPFFRILKYLGIWSAIALVFVSLYAYRFEFSDFKNRIIGAIEPSAARISKSGQLVINLSQDGHFYLNTKINDVDVLFMIDTGASDMILNTKDAKRAGINLAKLSFNKRYQTANGISWGANAILKKLEISGIIFESVPATVNNAEMGTSLLGMSFLRQFRKYEFYQDRLILTI